jgi:GGDEF domain-containing protein
MATWRATRCFGSSAIRCAPTSARTNVLVRYGGDELLCAMPSLTAAEARPRFEKIASALTSADTGHSVTFGLAEAESADVSKT